MPGEKVLIEGEPAYRVFGDSSKNFLRDLGDHVSEGTTTAGWNRGLVKSGFRTGGRGVVGAAGRGFASTFLPISPIPEMRVDKAAAGIESAAGGILPKGVKGVFGTIGKAAARWFGPLVLGYRLHSENKGLTSIQKMDRSVRIIGEEASMNTGIAVGGWVGAGLGSAFGVPGQIVGAAAGMYLGYLGGKAWNKVVDTYEAPAKYVISAYQTLREMGIRSKRVELGGQVSIGNSTQQAATMRQRALEQIYRSGINERSVLGREAQLMHLR
jgi:hypothetical protein